MAQWIPFLVRRGAPIEAPDLTTARAKAETLYGEACIQVRSAVSVRISDEDTASITRTRRAPWDEH